MITLSVAAIPGLDDWPELLRVEENKIRTAALRATNKMLRWTRPTISRTVAQDINIKVGLVRHSLKTVPARKTNLEAHIGLPRKSGVIKAIDLGRARQTQQGVTTGKRKWDKAFIGTMPTGHEGIYKRKGKSRLPIREMQLVLTGRLADAMENVATGEGPRQFKKLFERELKYLQRKT